MTCLRCDTADICAGGHSRHAWSVAQEACMLCVTQQTCLLRDTADMSAVSHSRHLLSEDRESIAYRYLRSEKSSSEGVRTVTTVINGLWQLSVHSDVAF